MRVYSLVEHATGEEVEVNEPTVERSSGIEICYIDWVIAQDGKFENWDWLITKPI